MFTGFSPETVDFLWGIRMNNNKEWFTEHKKDYIKYLYEPMKALGKELFEPFLDKPGNVLKVSRIYKDARLHPAVPYKESLWICIRQEGDAWEGRPCLYLEINPDEVHYGFFLWKLKTSAMEDFRKYISARPDEFLNLIRTTEEAVGQPITAEVYKRPKATENADLVPYFAWKERIGCIRTIAPGPEMFDPGLKADVSDFFTKLTPLYEYFNKF